MIYLLLPAYNEEHDIGHLLDKIPLAARDWGMDYQIVVVNDGSQDGTVREVKRRQADMHLELIEHPVNRGLGQAMLTGFCYIVDLIADDDVVVAMDADNTHDPSRIGDMVKSVRQGADVVIASRYVSGGQEIGLSLRRKIFSRCASLLLKFFFPMESARDYTCGYRGYRGGMLKQSCSIFGSSLIEEHGFTCMAEILIKMRSLSARVTEVPLILRYDLKTGPSKMKVTRTILRYFVLIAQNLGRRLPEAKAVA